MKKSISFLLIMIMLLVSSALAEPQLSAVFADDVTLTAGEGGWFVEFETSEGGKMAMELLSADPGLEQPENRPVLEKVRHMFADTPDIFN